MSICLRRREFIAGLGGAAAAWPLAALAQPAMPLIGYLSPGTPESLAHELAAFRKGLSETGYTEGRNVSIEFRWAKGDYDRLPEMAADLVRRGVAVIATPGNTAATLAAKAATTMIPIVFSGGGDPVQAGVVASFNRPGGNVTGVSTMTTELGAKQIGLLHELLPKAARFAALIYPQGTFAESVVADIRVATSTIGRRQLEIAYASTNNEIDRAFASFAQKRVEALLIHSTAFYATRRVQIVTLATRHVIPTISWTREYPEIGGLMSYGPDPSDTYRQVGIYTGRVLKGEKPAELPVMRPTKFELIINLQTAKALEIEVPPTLLAIADEVIE
jgi:putative ABC transport system substrate-binding protein